ncbi:MAG: cyclic nucleotide-binding domain-containing protein [Alphaproteobacteria bacterium]|nr:cyclic nucleotide-binding domain-containing protein [Alphaproteobacteria bacterium]
MPASPQDGGPPSADALRAQGLGWLLETSFLGHLGRAEQDRVLAACSWKEHGRDALIIRERQPGLGAELLVNGHCAVLIPGPDGALAPVARLGPGHLVGERSLLLDAPTGARVVAMSPVRSLHLPAAAFRTLLEQLPALRRYVEDLVSLRDRSVELTDLLLRNPFLRSLGRDDLSRFLQGACMERPRLGDAIVRAGERTADVYVVVAGEAAVYTVRPDGVRERITTQGAGWLFGHAAALLDQPRSADVIAMTDCELLRVRGPAFLEIVNRNARLRRQLYRDLAEMDLPDITREDWQGRPLAVSIYNAAARLGATTLAYAAAAVLCSEGEPTLLVDLMGDKTAARLGFAVTEERLAGVPIRRMTSPGAWRFQVLWPANRGEAPRLMSALRAQGGGGFILVAASTQSLEDREATQAADGVVFVSRGPAETWEVPDRRGQFRIDAVRLGQGAVRGVGMDRNTVRVGDDPWAAERFWTHGELCALSDPKRPLGRSAHRLVRALRGRTVGLALGGGGAWGFGHIGLIRALEEADVPIDYVAGTSFGAVVGGIYAVSGLTGLNALVEQRRRMLAVATASTVSTRVIQRFVDGIVDGRPMGATEVPFFPVATDVLSGRQVVLRQGSVGEGVRSSSGMPGVFPPMRVGANRLVDGGVVNNVPASVVWEAGADFVIASNVVPPNPGGHQRRPGRGVRDRISDWTIARLDDLQRAMYLLMWQGGQDRSRVADFVFDATLGDWAVYDFAAGDRISEEAYRQAVEHIKDLQRAYEAGAELLT